MSPYQAPPSPQPFSPSQTNNQSWVSVIKKMINKSTLSVLDELLKVINQQGRI
jgi:hypothetical protein